ncbi:MAG: type III pantothenate kinase, partial [Cetobacterium sp.]
MLLAVDIGNTHIVTGLLNPKGEVLLSFRVSSNEKLTEDEYFSYLKNICDFNGVEIKELNGIVISSVVPNLIGIFQFLG